MKKTEFKEYIKNEIVEILSEVSNDDIDIQKVYNAELEKTIALSKEAGLSEDDDTEPSAADIKKGDSIAKIATKLSANKKEIKTVVNQW